MSDREAAMCERIDELKEENAKLRELACWQEDDAEPFTCQWLCDNGWTERPFGAGRHFDNGDVTLVQDFSKEHIPVRWQLYLRGFEARMSDVPQTRGDVRRLVCALKRHLIAALEAK